MSSAFPYEATTRGVCVRVAPRFLEEDSHPDLNRYLWAYHIRIENHSTLDVQLRDRHWVITDAHGRIEEVRGEGVVGQQPLIAPGESYDYVSACPLSTPSGMMQGEYGMVDAHGLLFHVDIPPFSLDSPYGRAALN